MAAMRPAPRVRCWWRLRTQISRAASVRASRPEVAAAATSPTEWPRQRSGVMPSAASAATMPCWTAKSSGCARSVAASAASGTPAASASATDQPRCGASAASASWTPARKAGLAASASRPMPAHCAPLPLNTKATRRPPGGAGLARHGGGALRAGPPSGERADELGAGSAAHREPVRQEVAVAGGAAEQRRQGWDGRGGERGLPTRRQRVERRGGVRREQERRQRGPAFGFLIGRGRSGRRGGGEQRGGVGAAEAEAVDADHRGAAARASRQGLCGGGHAEAERGEVDGGVGRLEVQGGRDAAMLQHQHGLEQPGHAGGGLRVADIRLRGADRRAARSGAGRWPRRAPSPRSDRPRRCRCRAPRNRRCAPAGRRPRPSPGGAAPLAPRRWGGRGPPCGRRRWWRWRAARRAPDRRR